MDVNTTYVIQADITDSDGQSLEQFTALCYAGQLCGNAFGFNHLGLACSVNAVFPKLMASNGIGVQYIHTQTRTRAHMGHTTDMLILNMSATNSHPHYFLLCMQFRTSSIVLSLL